MNFDWGKILTTVGTLLVGGLCSWGIPAARRAAKNYGKTDVAIAGEKMEEAIKAKEAAHASEDPTDDKPADQKAAEAKLAFDHARRMQAIAEALADPGEPSTPS